MSRLPNTFPTFDTANPAPTAWYVSAYAKKKPNAIAVVDTDREWSYAEMHRDIGRFVGALGQLSLSPGDIVAVEWTKIYPHWIMLQAFETLGIVTASYSKTDLPYSQELMDTATLVLYAPKSPKPRAKRLHAITPDWLEHCFAREPEDTSTDCPHPSDQPVRLIQGSGTTGKVKMMLVTAQAQEYRVRQHLWRMNITPNEDFRHLVDLPLNVSSSFYKATVCLRSGGTCIWDKSKRLLDAINHHGITHTTLLIASLTQNLKQFPRKLQKPENLTILTIGGRLPEAAREQTLRYLAKSVVESYGSNEVTSIADIDPNGVGEISPDVTVEIIDENGKPLLNQAGVIRVKSTYMITGYFNDPAATKEKFQDGWFYPGDLGIMPEPGKLQVIGRSDDLLNLSGLKVEPSGLERKFRAIPSVKDACITALPQPDGGNQICISLVLAKNARLEDLQAKIFKTIPPLISNAKIVKFDALPKTNTGKIQRNRVNEMLRERLEKERP